MIFRDDDLCYGTFKPWKDKEILLNEEYLWDRFLLTDELFKKYKVDHTVAIIAKCFYKNRRLVNYINENKHIIPQLHCWEHIDYTIHNNLLGYHLIDGISEIENCFGSTPSHFFPPFNKMDQYVKKQSELLNLTISTEKIGLKAYVNGNTSEVVNFHYWDLEVDDYLEDALKKYTGR